MNLKKIYYLVLCALVACTTASCKDSNDDYIPPALEPEKPEVPVEPEDPRADVPIHVDGEPYTTYKGLLMTGIKGGLVHRAMAVAMRIIRIRSGITIVKTICSNPVYCVTALTSGRI